MFNREVLLILIASIPVLAFADEPGPSVPNAPEVSSSVASAEQDAKVEYDTVLKERAKKGPAGEAPSHSYSNADLENLAAKLGTSTRNDKNSVMENLAEEVNALKNKVIVERTTLLATQSPPKVRVMGARTVFNYSENSIFEVTSSIDHVTDIQLAPGEKLTTPPSAGDTVRWNVGVMQSGDGEGSTTHLIIKPLDDNIETNLIVATDARVYQLKLKSGNFHMPVVAWNYPEDFEAKMQDSIKRDASQEATIAPESLRFSYNISGKKYAWKPIRVFDDGKKTFIQMPSSMRVSEAPAFFLIENSGDPMLVNYRVKGDYYIVDRLFQKAELRVGTDEKIKIELGSKKNWFERVFL